MVEFLEKLKPKVENGNSLNKKILCIIEGNIELRYIVKVFKLFGYEKDCHTLSSELIKVAWGKNLPIHKNIVNENCKFQGGSLKDRKVPFPAIDAFELYSKDLSIFDSVIVFFDGDKDIENKVEKYFNEELKKFEIKHCLLVSIPCFESTLIDFCVCGKCRAKINSIEEEKYPCDKYKNNFSKLGCFSGVKHLIANLEIDSIKSLESSNLTSANELIENFMAKL